MDSHHWCNQDCINNQHQKS